jgi:hypothetical protein
VVSGFSEGIHNRFLAPEVLAEGNVSAPLRVLKCPFRERRQVTVARNRPHRLKARLLQRLVVNGDMPGYNWRPRKLMRWHVRQGQQIPTGLRRNNVVLLLCHNSPFSLD